MTAAPAVMSVRSSRWGPTEQSVLSKRVRQPVRRVKQNALSPVIMVVLSEVREMAPKNRALARILARAGTVSLDQVKFNL